MSLSSYQGTFNGISFGAGTNIQILKMDGVEDLPPVVDNDLQRTTVDGAFAALDILKPRVFSIDFLVLDTTTLQTWRNATINQPGTNLLPLSFMLPGWSANRRINCRPRRRMIPVTAEFQWSYIQMTVEWIAEDPRWYDDTATTTATAASVTATNNGNYAAPATIVAVGNNPTITGPNSGSLALTGNTTWTIDVGAHTITGGNGYTDLTQPATWFSLPTGASTVATTNGTVAVTYRSAWI